MQHPILYLLAICLIASNTQAQTTPPVKHWSAGVLGGVVRSVPLSNVNQNPVYNVPNRFAAAYQPVIGLDVQYKLNQRSSLHIQPSYTSIKEQKSKSNDWPTAIYTYSLSSIKFPVLFRYRLLSAGTTPFFEVGASYNQALSGKNVVDLTSYCDFAPCPNNPMYYTEYSLTGKSAVSAIAGLGVNIELQKISVPIVLRYERYLSDHTFSSSSNPNPSYLKFEGVMLLTGINF